MSDYIDNVNSLAKYNELEPFLVLVQLYLIKGNLTGATKVLQNLNQFPECSRQYCLPGVGVVDIIGYWGIRQYQQ